MEELNYRPNRLARSLRTRRSNIVGLIIPDNTNPFYAELSRGIEDVCYEHGLSVILGNSDVDGDKELHYLDILAEIMADGAIIVPSVHEQVEQFELLTSMPTVLVDRVVSGVDLDSVLVDNEQGGYLATQHLIDKGHRRVGCIAGPVELTPGADRLAGYRRAHAESGIEVDETLIKLGDFRYQSGFEKAMELFEMDAPPTALFVCNEVMALGAIGAAHSKGLRIPEHLSVVGFDDTYLAKFLVPPLTTIRQPCYEIGHVAAEMLVGRIADPNLSARRRELKVELIERESTRSIK